VSNVSIGVDTGGTSTKGALVGGDGRILRRAEVATDPVAGTAGILAVVDELLAAAADQQVVVDGIGVGVAGFVDAATGSVIFSPNLAYDDPQVRAAVQARADVPVVVDNDANAAVWGERAFGAAKGFDDVALLTLGTGIGSGFIVAGRLIRGHRGAGAELGHTVIDPDGPACPCGRRGCLERFASGTAIEAMAAATGTWGTAPTGEDIARAAAGGDEGARIILGRAGASLAVGLVNVVNIFDPAVIVLAGSVVEAGEPYLGPVREGFERALAAQRRQPVPVEVGHLGNDAGIAGAAAMVRERTNTKGGLTDG
jgi:glucokinase